MLIDGMQSEIKDSTYVNVNVTLINLKNLQTYTILNMNVEKTKLLFL